MNKAVFWNKDGTLIPDIPYNVAPPYITLYPDAGESLHRLWKAGFKRTVVSNQAGIAHKTNADSLCLAGGVALNCIMNIQLHDHGPFKNIWVQPAVGDAGTALGAAMWIDAQQRETALADDRQQRRYTMEQVYLGLSFSDDEIDAFLCGSKLPYRRLSDPANEVASYLAAGNIIGWFQQGMEFGARALEARLIIALLFSAEMQARLNDLKDREEFQPVAPAVSEEAADIYVLNAYPSPFMLFVNDVRAEMIDVIPDVTHTDGTVRIQMGTERRSEPYYQLLKAFAEPTGVPVLVNTSFNTRGQPVVCTPLDAVESFWTSPLDALGIGSFFLEKTIDSNQITSNTWTEQTALIS